jgi:hypothetical protein
MSKVTQIERALQSLDPAGFQRLCDLYLRKRGHDSINRIGLVLGADKVAKGTPDTLLKRSDGDYDFAEYSAQQQGLGGKFSEDVAKCLDENKTGIPLGRIREIILCHNGRLTPKEEYELGEQCRLAGVMLSIHGPGEIAYDLYQKYPGLARDLLHVEVDTGQIVPVDEFVDAYNKRSFATRLDTIFKFREEQLAEARKALSEGKLVLISGKPGVGKTRFAIECCDRYAKDNPDVRVRCIFNKGANLFEDIRVHFSEPGHFLIFVDDTNRVSSFEYPVELLTQQRPDQKIRLVATVRDYALTSAIKAAELSGVPTLVELQSFTEGQIKDLVKDNSSIKNHYYLDRIARVAQGNPRLAMMAARIAEDANTLQSIADVSSLYDKYFESVRNDLEELGDPKIILVAGIIAFFRTIIRSNAEMMGAISDNFQINSDEFWQAATRLHEMEVVDMYENDIVRISDQVLSTYLFYVAAFRDCILDLGIILERLFPDYRHRLIDALNPVLNAFDSKTITEILRPHVDRACQTLHERKDEEGLMALLDVFWYVKQTDTLIYLKEKIDALAAEPTPTSGLSFVKSNALPPSPSILGILDNFGSSGELSLKTALSLILDYLEKKPAEVSLVIRTLEEHYGVDPYSHLNGFIVEHETVDAVWSRTREGANELLSRLFLTIAGPLLQTHFQTTESRSGKSLAIINFDVPASKHFLELRLTLWQRLFVLYSSPLLSGEVLRLISRHSKSGYLVGDVEIIKFDSDHLVGFFESSLDPSNYSHCLVVQDYLDMMERVGLDVQTGLREKFTNEFFKLSELVLVDRRERSDLGWKEYEALQRDRLAAYTAGFNEADFAQLLDRCAEISKTSDGSQFEYQVRMSVTHVLLDLAERDPALFLQVFQDYINNGNSLGLPPWAFVGKLVELAGADRAYEIIHSARFLQRVSWLFAYFVVLPEDNLTQTRLQQLYDLYGSAVPEDIPYGVDHLLKFLPFDKDVVIKVTRLLVSRAKAEPTVGYALSGIFTERAEAGRRMRELFAEQVDLLKQAYFDASEADDHEDFDGEFFNDLLDLDPNFAREWVLQLHERMDRPSRRDDSRDYAFIWRRGDFIRIMEQIVDAVTDCGKKRFIYDPCLLTFFALQKETPDIDDLRKRQDDFLDDVISRRSDDRRLMGELFEVISALSPERRRRMFETFVLNNKDYETFSRLPTSSDVGVYWGSAVPRLQKRVEFLESLLPILSTVELLRHRQHIEQLIQRTRDGIEREKRSDFMGDDY